MIDCGTAQASSGAGFAASADGARWTCEGALTFDNVTEVHAATLALPLPSAGVVDLAGLVRADSSALALLLSLLRRAQGERQPLCFERVPDELLALARVYGIDELVAPAGA